MKMKSATWVDWGQAADALEHLRQARDLLKLTGCDKSVERVRSAIKSVEGALRHLDRRIGHSTLASQEVEQPGASKC